MPQETGLTLLEQDFESARAAIASGYGEGVYEGLRYGVSVLKVREGKGASLFARAARGRRRRQLQPLPAEVGRRLFASCEMPAEKIVALFSGMSPTFRKLEQVCAVPCNVCVAAR